MLVFETLKMAVRDPKQTVAAFTIRSSPDKTIAVFAAHKQSIKIQGFHQSHHKNLKQVAGKTQNPVTDENYYNLRFTF